MRNITSYSREEIVTGFQKSQKSENVKNDHIRILFAPTEITEANFEQACSLYSRVDPDNYETAVIVEVHEEVLTKKLPMASNRYFETPLGQVQVNDYLRNEFCDEDDDFFIHDEPFDKKMSLFDQLMMLQSLDGDMNVLSVKIADENHYIIKELAHVIEEVLGSRNVLLVFCCDLPGDRKKEFKRLKTMLDEENHSGLLNYLNSGESHITGTAAFIAGLMVAHNWGLKLNFIDEESDENLLASFAERDRTIY